MLVTSSYVNVPPTERLPDIVALVTCKVPIVPTPDTFRPVVTPVMLIPLLKSTGVLNLSVVPAPVALIPVSADPSIAGNADGNLASGIVPELRFDAFKLVKFAPDPSEVIMFLLSLVRQLWDYQRTESVVVLVTLNNVHYLIHNINQF